MRRLLRQLNVAISLALISRVLGFNGGGISLLTSRSPCSQRGGRLWSGLGTEKKIDVGDVDADLLSKGAKGASGAVASAAVIATAAVSSAVATKQLEAPSVSKSFISMDKKGEKKDVPIDDLTGLPLIYDKESIEQYWKKEKNALNKRWAEFVRLSAPFLTRMTTIFISEGAEGISKNGGSLATQARKIIQQLGPTFVKAGQMMSVRPDVLPDEALVELAILQDSVEAFDTKIAIEVIERELGGPMGDFFSSISEEPVAAASLAQVYKATLASNNKTVAVKVQRPSVLQQVSKDLYVLRRAAEVYQGLIDRFAPQQRTNYVALLNEFAVGFYTELDFDNERKNQERMRQLFIEQDVQGVMVPEIYPDLCTRRLLVSEWVEGTKLSSCSDSEISRITPIAQEAFLVQLLQVGLFHADPHPGNLLRLHEPGPNGEKIALIDFGLVAEIKLEDRELFVQAIIHMANKDYAQLVDDFIALKILPPDCNRPKVVPLMDKALSPYIKGGGAKQYEERLKEMYEMDKSMVGGFQAMTQDALTVLNDIPFSIPPYFAILGRAIVTLEGIALTGKPSYALIMESYPFIARKLLNSDRPAIQMALQELLYSYDPNDPGSASSNVKLSRLVSLVNAAAGVEVDTSGGMIDLDADFGSDGLDLKGGLKYVMGKSGSSIRTVLKKEAVVVGDLIFRNIVRKSSGELERLGPRLPSVPRQLNFLLPPTPDIKDVTLPFILPGFKVELMKVSSFIDALAPKLSREEELYALSIGDALGNSLGGEVEKVVRGEGKLSLGTARSILEVVKLGGLARIVDTGGVVNSDSLNSIITGASEVLGSGEVGELYHEMENALSDQEKEVYSGFKEDVISELVLKIEGRMR